MHFSHRLHVWLPVLLSLLSACTSAHETPSGAARPKGDPCARLQSVIALCGAPRDPALSAILAESQGTTEARALMAVRCEQLAAPKAAVPECHRKLAARGVE